MLILAREETHSRSDIVSRGPSQTVDDGSGHLRFIFHSDPIFELFPRRLFCFWYIARRYVQLHPT